MKTPVHKNRAGLMKAGLVFTGILLLCACGITAPRSNEGYADLQSLGMFDTDRVITLSIGPLLLNIAAFAVHGEEPELAVLLRSIDGVRIRIYEIDGDAERVAKRVQSMSRHLRDDHWQPVILIQEDGEQTHMLMRSRGDRIQGLTLITSNYEEAVVINVMGNLDPVHFSDVMFALDVDAPEVEVAALN